ncbi:hypothetical protein EVJ58_g9805 [Rhodofomes roseus]|uniref:Uncharacterized protein n=1 Tax=Rhodofomes roseus TaxID=34475 RepID=A0A4Y9XTR3_9APHY|nr:hypothetical protein EVJ58_g9805 [Rhodofomes roseus]
MDSEHMGAVKPSDDIVLLVSLWVFFSVGLVVNTLIPGVFKYICVDLSLVAWIARAEAVYLFYSIFSTTKRAMTQESVPYVPPRTVYTKDGVDYEIEGNDYDEELARALFGEGCLAVYRARRARQESLKRRFVQGLEDDCTECKTWFEELTTPHEISANVRRRRFEPAVTQLRCYTAMGEGDRSRPRRGFY